MLTEAEREKLFKISWALAGASKDEADLSAAVVQEVLTFIGADEADYNSFDLSASRANVTLFPRPELAPEVASQLAQVAHEHPIIRHIEATGSERPIRLSDVASAANFSRTRIYETLFKPRGLRYQVAVPIRVRGLERTGAGYALNRSHRDFDDGAMRRAIAVQPVLAALHATLEVRPPPETRMVEAKKRSDLTAREIDILTLVASGLTADAISRARRISVKTVRKHLENAYSKIGVHDRLRAVDYCRRMGLICE